MEFSRIPEITITPEDVAAYYAKIGISDYPKRDGMPNMKQNKTVIKILYEEKKQKLINDKKAESCALRDTIDDCPVCLEPMRAGRSILDCAHVFCIQCSIQHFRTKQTCPLCRAEVCGPPTKHEVIPMSNETIREIVQENLLDTSERYNVDLYTFIVTSARRFKQSNEDAHEFTDKIYEEIRRFGVDVSNEIKNWYEN